MLSQFFKLNRNLDDCSLLVIPTQLHSLPSTKTNLMEARWIPILTWCIVILLCNWSTLVDYPPSLPHQTCQRFMLFQMKMHAHLRSQRKIMMFHINVKKHGLFKCHGWRCWQTNLEKLIQWIAWFVFLRMARMWSWGWRTLTLLKNM